METLATTITAHVIGRVQGVSFRAWTKRQADDLGLSGWVANDPDGSVRAVFSGSERAVSEIADLLREGPSGAEVHNVVIVPGEPEGPPTGFEIRG